MIPAASAAPLETKLSFFRNAEEYYFTESSTQTLLEFAVSSKLSIEPRSNPRSNQRN